jgi:hypothetical protein
MSMILESSLRRDRAPANRAVRSPAGIALFGILVAIFYLVAEFWDGFGRPWGPGGSAIFALSCFALHVALSHRRISSIDPVVWVPIVMLLFSFGIPVAVGILGLSPVVGYDAFHVGVSPSLSRGFCLALLTVACLLWGIHLAGLADLSRGSLQLAAPDRSIALPSVLMTLGGCLMFVVGIVILGPSAVFGSYGGFWDAMNFGGDQRLMAVGAYFIQGGVFGMIASHDRRHRARFILVMLVSTLFVFVNLQIGARTSLMCLGIGCGWCYSQRVRRVPLALVLGGAVFVLLLMPIVGEYRVEKTMNLEHRSAAQLASAAFTEMGGSALAFGYALDYIPKSKGYTYGLALVGSVVDLVPNFGLTEGGGKPFRITSRDLFFSHWITSTLAPEWYANGGGLGTSLGAEWYFYFGIPGIIVGVTLMGYGMSRVRNASQNSALKLVASALIFAAMLIAVRSEIGVGLKTAAWPIFGLWVMKKAISGLAKNKIAPHEDTVFPPSWSPRGESPLRTSESRPGDRRSQ